MLLTLIALWVLSNAAILVFGYRLAQLRARREEAAARQVRSNVIEIRRRPHTESTLEERPLPEQRPASDGVVADVVFGRSSLPNSGVDWTR